MYQLDIESGIVDQAEYLASPNCAERQPGNVAEVIILHSISLPPGQYDNNYVEAFFLNELAVDDHHYFSKIEHLRVSTHFYIKRDGHLLQFVPTKLAAWHAGESCCLDRPGVNEFSIGIEMQGLDTGTDGYTSAQYKTLRRLIRCLRSAYPSIKADKLFAHSDIAPGRKTDPGPYFEWSRALCGES